MFRITPRMPPQAYKTFQVLAPTATHFRDVACEHVNCIAQAHGWKTAVDERTELGAAQAHYIRTASGRKFTEDRTPEGLTVFDFEAGQQCFAQHKERLEVPAIYLVRGGDWRGNPLGIEARQHTRPEWWVEEFGEHQQKLADEIEKG